MPGLGRRWTADWNDLRHLARAVLPRVTLVEERHWDDDYWWGDQGETNQCVGYSLTHFLEDGPVLHHRETPPVVNPSRIYFEAQQVDEWPGVDYEGTSVRGGAKVLQGMGYISEFRWALTAQEVAAAILEIGPVVVGTVWTDDMSYPDENGIIRPTGYEVGGHAYLLNGYNSYTGLFRIKNSWGRNWGERGHAYLHIEDLQLLLDADGEACLALEAILPIVNPDPDVVIVVPDPVVVPDPIPQPEPQPDPDPLPGPEPEPHPEPEQPEEPEPEVEPIGWLDRLIDRVWAWFARIFT